MRLLCMHVEKVIQKRISIPIRIAPTLFYGGKKKRRIGLNDIRFALGHKKVETTIKYLGENNERLMGEATDQYYSNNEDLYQIAGFSVKGRRDYLGSIKNCSKGYIRKKISEKLKEEMSLVTTGEAKIL